MKRALRIVLLSVVLVLCIGLVGYSNNFAENQIHLIDNSKETEKPLRWHFVLIGQDMSDSFWQSVESGAKSAGQKYQAAIEVNGPLIQNEDDEIKDFNIAIASQVDGIAVYATDTPKFKALINKAVSKGIQVVTIESDDKNSNRKAYIGPYSYDVGTAQGTMAVESANGRCCVAMIMGGNYADKKDASDLLLSGFKDSIRPHSQITLKSVYYLGSGYFGAEKTIRNIIYEQPQINTIVCTSADSTLEAVQVLIDLNKTSRISVIGYSNSQQIRDYIKNNTIFGSVYENPADTGYKSIECLAEIMSGKPVAKEINTGVYTITRNNLVTYTDGS